MVTTRLLALALLAASPALAAQNPVSNAARQLAAAHRRDLVAAAKDMPAAKYTFKPTAKQWTFAQLVLHIREDNRETCGALSGKKPADETAPQPTDAKEKLIASLEQSFVFCDSALANVADAQLGDSVTWYGGPTHRADVLVGLIDDWSDHYGQAAIYMRLVGVLPPTARKGS